MSATANAAQVDYWNTHVGRTWAECHEALDRQIRPLGERALLALAPQAGERFLDIGCGCGETTLDLARAVGPSGAVDGIDISEPMLAVARARVLHPKSGRVSFQAADAQSEPFAAATYDGFYSRFGVMFFADPAAAFTNLRRALKPGGRFAFVCWRPLADNPWMSAPLAAAQPHLPPRPVSDPTAPGPFAFADAARLRGLLVEAGFEAIEFARFDTGIGAGSVEDSLALALRVGPLGSALREAPYLAPAVAPAVHEVLLDHLTEEGVKMPASVWIVTGRRPT